MKLLCVTALSLTGYVVCQCPPPPPPPPPPAPPSYAGPGDKTPGGAANTPGGPAAPRAAAPSAPAPAKTGGPSAPTAGRSGPTTGGPSGPSAGAPGGLGGSSGARGAALEDDLTTWDQWWEFNQDGFLAARLGSATVVTGSDQFFLGSTRRTEAWSARLPAEEVLINSVLPVLRGALNGAQHRELTTACLLALARIGLDHPEFTLTDVFVPRLLHSDQSVRETAALALGLAGGNDRYRQDILTSLALDQPSGQKLSGGAISDRTRAFAAYGLGLAANGATDVAGKQRAFEALASLLAADSSAEPGRSVSLDLKVAAIQGIGVLGLDQRKYAEVKLVQSALDVLEEYFLRDVSGGERIVQAHCPTAIARLLPRDGTQADRFKQLFASELTGKSRTRRSGHGVAQSCALALGQLVRANNGEVATDSDTRFSEVLLDVWRDHKDTQTRNFAILALGQIGGMENRAALLRSFGRAGGTLEKPWCALALGVLAHATGSGDKVIGDALSQGLRRSKDPGLVSAIAIALGLSRATEASDAMRQRLMSSLAQDKLAGCLALGLGLLADGRIAADLHKVVDEAAHRPELLEPAAVALGRLGDPRIAEILHRRLIGDANQADLAGIATALSTIGDGRSVPTLVATLSSSQHSEVVRSHAAAILGGIGDRRSSPWNAPLSKNSNYRAAVATFTDRTAGILDLL